MERERERELKRERERERGKRERERERKERERERKERERESGLECKSGVTQSVSAAERGRRAGLARRPKDEDAAPILLPSSTSGAILLYRVRQ